MLTIGLTGGIGSGKSTVADMFAQLGIAVIDTDLIAREVTLPGTKALEKIVAHFGKSISLSDGQLNRQQLAELIFQNPEEKKWLEKLLHPLILEKMEQSKRDVHSPYCIVVIPLLIETNTNVDRILVIDAPPSLQISRTHQRDPQRSITEIQSIVNSQVSREQRLQAADDVINNDSSLDDLRAQVQNLHEQYLALCK